MVQPYLRGLGGFLRSRSVPFSRRADPAYRAAADLRDPTHCRGCGTQSTRRIARIDSRRSYLPPEYRLRYSRRSKTASIPASRQRDKPPHLFRSERPINRLLGTTTKSHYPKNAATFGTLERPHLAPSGKRRNSYMSPCDIAVTAFALDIHGATPFGRKCATLRRAVYVGVNFRDRGIPGVEDKTPCSALCS